MILDGKTITSLENKQWHGLEIKITNAFIPKINYRVIQDINVFLENKNVTIIPQEYWLCKIWDPEISNIFIDIWDSNTSISLKLNNNILWWIVQLDIGIWDLVKEIKKHHDRSRSEIIKKLDREDLFKSEKQEFLSIFESAIVMWIQELLQWEIWPRIFILTGGWANNIFIKESIQSINFVKEHIKIPTPIEFRDLPITEIKKITGVEDILKISNINSIAQIIAANSLTTTLWDTTEHAIKKSIKKIVT
jgi:hypothetical protein